MVDSLVHVDPPSLDNHKGAFVLGDKLHAPEKLVMTIWFELAGLSATDGSLPPVVSVLAKFGTVLLTAGSTTPT